MHFTTECPTEREQEIINNLENRFAVEIDKIKDEQIQTEQLLLDKDRDIVDKEKTIVTLQNEYDLLDIKLQSAKEKNVQDQSLIDNLEEERSVLKNRLSLKKSELEDDKIKFKESIEVMLRNEALLRDKITTLMKKNCQLKRELRCLGDKRNELQNDVTLQQEQMNVLKVRHSEKVQQMTIQLENLRQMVSEKEKECLAWKTKSENIPIAVGEGTRGEAMPPSLRLGHDRIKQTEKVTSILTLST